MGLKIENEQIDGTIDNLEDKLEGKLPVDRLELIYLVNSWGRVSTNDYEINGNKIEKIEIKKYEPKECYNLSKLDVSQVTDMSYIFKCSMFDGDISNWEVSSVTSMNNMFWRAINFNSPIDSWDVSNVTSMDKMFYNASSFNKPIGSWDTSNVVNMKHMFYFCDCFNQDLKFWNTNNVTNMYGMFSNAVNFNQSLNTWNTS